MVKELLDASMKMSSETLAVKAGASMSLQQKITSLIFVAVGPLAVYLAWAFLAKWVPLMSPSMQNAINNGGPGMLLGIFGGAALVSCLAISWGALQSLRQNFASSRS